jgi:hypothetical protein
MIELILPYGDDGCSVMIGEIIVIPKMHLNDPIPYHLYIEPGIPVCNVLEYFRQIKDRINLSPSTEPI